MVDYLSRSLIGYSCGHYTSQQIQAINLTQSENISHKKIGESEFRITPSIYIGINVYIGV